MHACAVRCVGLCLCASLRPSRSAWAATVDGCAFRHCNVNSTRRCIQRETLVSTYIQKVSTHHHPSASNFVFLPLRPPPIRLPSVPGPTSQPASQPAKHASCLLERPCARARTYRAARIESSHRATQRERERGCCCPAYRTCTAMRAVRQAFSLL